MAVPRTPSPEAWHEALVPGQVGGEGDCTKMKGYVTITMPPPFGFGKVHRFTPSGPAIAAVIQKLVPRRPPHT